MLHVDGADLPHLDVVERRAQFETLGERDRPEVSSVNVGMQPPGQQVEVGQGCTHSHYLNRVVHFTRSVKRIKKYIYILL